MWSLTRAEQRDRILSLILLDTLLFEQPAYNRLSGLKWHAADFISNFSPTQMPESCRAALSSQPLLMLVTAQINWILLNFMRFTLCQSSSLSSSLWMASCPYRTSAAPLTLVSPASLLRMHSIHCSCH